MAMAMFPFAFLEPSPFACASRAATGGSAGAGTAFTRIAGPAGTGIGTRLFLCLLGALPGANAKPAGTGGGLGI